CDSACGSCRAALASFNLDEHNVRVGSRDIERDSTVGAGRQPGTRQLGPRLSGIVRFPECAARASAIKAAAASATLIAGGVEYMAVRWIDRDVGKARVVVDELDLVPRPSAISRLEDAAVGIRAKKVSGGSHAQGLWI